MSPFVRYPSLAVVGLTFAALIAYPRAGAKPEAGYAVEQAQLDYEAAELQNNLRAIAGNPSVIADPSKPPAKQDVVIQTSAHANHHQH